MNYCEKCNILTDLEYCPNCGNKNLRQPFPDEFCFLTECGQKYGEILSDAFKKSDIKCVLLPHGSGVLSRFALPLENYKVYVPFKDYEAASALTKTILNKPDTDKLKADILTNIDKWYVVKPSTVKRILKKTNADNGADVFDIIKRYVENAESVEDKGLIAFSDNRYAHGIAVKSGGLVFWFSAETYEILF